MKTADELALELDIPRDRADWIIRYETIPDFDDEDVESLAETVSQDYDNEFMDDYYVDELVAYEGSLKYSC